MFSRLYRVLLSLSWLLLVVGIGVGSGFEGAVSTFGAIVAGVGASLLASTYIQSMASEEQSAFLRELTLAADGVKPLPEAFLHLQWIAYATRVPDGFGGKRVTWIVAPLKKIGTTGHNLAQYRVVTKNPNGQPSVYACTFIGLTGCIAAIISKGKEITSAIIFDVPVEDAGTYFGATYLTDWLGERDLTLAIVGSIAVPSNVHSLPNDVFDRFLRWYGRVDWSVEAAFSEIQSRNSAHSQPGAAGSAP